MHCSKSTRKGYTRADRLSSCTTYTHYRRQLNKQRHDTQCHSMVYGIKLEMYSSKLNSKSKNVANLEDKQMSYTNYNKNILLFEEKVMLKNYNNHTKI